MRKVSEDAVSVCGADAVGSADPAPPSMIPAAMARAVAGAVTRMTDRAPSTDSPAHAARCGKVGRPGVRCTPEKALRRGSSPSRDHPVLSKLSPLSKSSGAGRAGAGRAGAGRAGAGRERAGAGDGVSVTGRGAETSRAGALTPDGGSVAGAVVLAGVVEVKRLVRSDLPAATGRGRAARLMEGSGAAVPSPSTVTLRRVGRRSCAVRSKGNASAGSIAAADRWSASAPVIPSDVAKAMATPLMARATGIRAARVMKGMTRGVAKRAAGTGHGARARGCVVYGYACTCRSGLAG